MADFGTDLTLKGGLTGALVSGPENLLEAVGRFIRTPRGGLFYDPDYGSSLIDSLGSDLGDRGQSIAAVLEVELEELPRVRNATVLPTLTGLRSLELRVFLETDLGPFELVVSAAMIGVVLQPVIEITPPGVG